MATEGIITFPMHCKDGHVLSTLSHFFEFIPIDSATGKADATAIPACEVQKGRMYSVVITTGGGFYRYRLSDLVIVEDFYRSCPVLRFIGKEDHFSDHMGEKLSEYHVQKVLGQAFTETGLPTVFSLLTPEDSDQGFRYALFIEMDETGRIEQAASLKVTLLKSVLSAVEKGLHENYHYAYCRRLDQIKPPVLYVLEQKNGVSASDIFLNESMKRGQRLGNIKSCVLHRETGWKEAFMQLITMSVGGDR